VAGKWFDAAVIPGDTVRVSGMDILARQVERQVGVIVAEAAAASATAAKGTALQQVGDYYASGMDTARLASLGVTPITAELDAILVDSPTAIARTLAHLLTVLNEPVMAAVLVSADMSDRTRYAVFIGDAELPMGLDNYLKPETAPIRKAYTEMIAAKLAIAGSSAADASRIAAKVVEIETRVARKKLTPVQMANPNVRFVRMPFAKAQAMLSHIDLPAYLAALGLPPQNDVIVMNAAALAERNAMLGELPASDTRDYLRWELLRFTSAYLSPAFLEPSMAFSRAIYGTIDTPPREKLVSGDVSKRLGHPVSQLYVGKHFPAASKAAATALIGEVRSTFRARLEANTWLSPATRAQAIEKLDKMVILVGYPDRWIDSSSVDIRRDDYMGNVFRLNAWSSRRELARFGKPITYDDFADSGSTQPIDINAAYNPGRNNIQIPAAFLQQPFYDPKADAAVNYCTLGAVIGHEITHGFDSSGRLYDGAGNVRSWWTDADGQAFAAQAQKLVAQGNAFQVLPGLTVNGALSVGENLADVGGLSLAYEALTAHLAQHPDAAKPIGGFTPQQRCFLAWGQAWADKGNEGWLRQVTPTDPHPPGIYRLLAPAQHEKGFFEAFGIKSGDPSWRAEKDRVAIW
jgi:predicted metalloendopeptidase